MASFLSEFGAVIEDAKKKFDLKQVEYGDSWKQMSDHDLRRRLAEEYEEYLGAGTAEGEYTEMVDVVVVALMYATRIRGTLSEVIENETSKENNQV